MSLIQGYVPNPRPRIRVLGAIVKEAQHHYANSPALCLVR